MASSKDVAKKAGVSQTTVSRVLNTPHLVKEPTRQRVFAAIEALNYIPDANARSLVSKKSNTIALISGPLDNPFYVDTTSSIVNYATSKGYRVNVHFSTTENVQAVYDIALSNKIDGLIVSSILLQDPLIERVKKIGLPFISFNRRHATEGNFVEIDNFEAGRQAFLQLWQYGHRDILWIGAADVVSTFKNRFLGFKSAQEQVNEARLSVRSINYKQLDAPDLQKLLTNLYKEQRLPSAICAATDAIAIEAMDILMSLGLSIPNDVSVMGIDNVKMGRNQLIQLTTIGTHHQQCIGLLAIKKLIDLIEKNSDEQIQLTLPVSVYLRQSIKNISN